MIFLTDAQKLQDDMEYNIFLIIKYKILSYKLTKINKTKWANRGKSKDNKNNFIIK